MITLSHHLEQGVDVVEFHGRLSASDASTVSDQLKRIIENGGKFISIDMKHLDFVDSSGLSVLISNLKLARNGGGNLVLINVNERIMSLLELTRLNEIIDIFDDQASLFSALK